MLRLKVENRSGWFDSSSEAFHFHTKALSKLMQSCVQFQK